MRNKEVIEHDVNALWNAHDLSAIDDGHYHPEFVMYMNEMPAMNLDQYRNYVAAAFNDFPDITLTILNLYEEGDVVTKHWSFQGTHSGDMLGVPPTGNVVTLKNAASIYRIVEGKIVQLNEVFDSQSFYQQLGGSP